MVFGTGMDVVLAGSGFGGPVLGAFVWLYLLDCLLGFGRCDRRTRTRLAVLVAIIDTAI